MYERVIIYSDGSSVGFSAIDTVEEALEMLLNRVKDPMEPEISEISIKCVVRPTCSDKDMRSLSGIASYK